MVTFIVLVVVNQVVTFVSLNFANNVKNCDTTICEHCVVECGNIDCEAKCCKDCVRYCDKCYTNWCNDCAEANQYCNKNGDYCTCHEMDDDDIDNDQDDENDGSES